MKSFIINIFIRVAIISGIIFFSVFAFNLAESYIEKNANHSHKYKMIDADGYFAGYTNDLTRTNDGCVKTTEGIVCGSYKSRLNEYYKGQ